MFFLPEFVGRIQEQPPLAHHLVAEPSYRNVYLDRGGKGFVLDPLPQFCNRIPGLGDKDGQGFASEGLVGDRLVVRHHLCCNLLHQVPCKINPGVLAGQENVTRTK